MTEVAKLEKAALDLPIDQRVWLAQSLLDSLPLPAAEMTEAAEIEAKSRRESAAIVSHAYQADPELYTALRSLDTLGTVIGPNTKLILRTDAAPFNMLIQGPNTAGAPK